MLLGWIFQNGKHKLAWCLHKMAMDKKEKKEHYAKVEKGDAWITVHPHSKEGKGFPVLLDSSGVIKAGIGKKFIGQHIDLIPRNPDSNRTKEREKSIRESLQKGQTELRVARYEDVGERASRWEKEGVKNKLEVLPTDMKGLKEYIKRIKNNTPSLSEKQVTEIGSVAYNVMTGEKSKKIFYPSEQGKKIVAAYNTELNKRMEVLRDYRETYQNKYEEYEEYIEHQKYLESEGFDEEALEANRNYVETLKRECDNLVEEYSKQAKKYNKIMDARNKIRAEYPIRQANAIKNALSDVIDIRDVSTAEINKTCALTPKLKKSSLLSTMATAWSVLPSGLHENITNFFSKNELGQNGKIPVRMATRTYKDGREFWGGSQGFGLMPDTSLSTVIHETMHAYEDTNPKIRELEKEFFNRRTAGQKEAQLSKLTNNLGYRKDEKAIADNFIHPYMGKNYNGRYFELLSMGAEMLYQNPKELFEKDPDYAKFILGCLLI